MQALLRTAETERFNRVAMISTGVRASVSSRSCFNSADDHILAALGLLTLLISPKIFWTGVGLKPDL